VNEPGWPLGKAQRTCTRYRRGVRGLESRPAIKRPTGLGSVFTRVVSTVGLFVPAVFVFAACLANSFFRTSRGICLKLVAPFRLRRLELAMGGRLAVQV
jgi:hypothetical protein